MARIGFAISGSGRMARSAILERTRLGVEVSHAILDDVAHPDLDDWMADHGVTTTRLSGATRASTQAEIHEVIAGIEDTQWMLTFDRVIRCDTVMLRPGAITNFHPALLPANPGMHPVRKALRSGARFTGATLHEIDCEVDAGRTIAQCIVRIDPNDDEESLSDRIFASGRPLFLQVCAWHAAGRVITSPTTGQLIVEGGDYSDCSVAPAIEPTVRSIAHLL